jgi:spore maturation protein B
MMAGLHMIADSLFLSLVAGIPLFAFIRGVKVFDAFVEGAKDGFDVILRILPFLVGMLVAIGMLRASGAFDLLMHLVSPLMHRLSIPTAVLPLALMRPFSGSASNAILADIIHQFGGNAFESHLAATMMGSTETTFYIIAIYFGAVGIKKTRYAIHAGLIADVVGIMASVMVCRWLLL